MLHCRTEEKVEEMCAFECLFKYIYIRRKNVKKNSRGKSLYTITEKQAKRNAFPLKRPNISNVIKNKRQEHIMCVDIFTLHALNLEVRIKN